MLVYAVRHAESLTNAGQDDGLNTGLSPLGKRQVQALVRRFGAAQITAVYSSPYLRCIETAVPIAGALHFPVRLRSELCEYHHLDAGTPADINLDPIDMIVKRHADLLPCPDDPGPFEWPPADEPDAGVIARTKAFAAYLKKRWQNPQDTVLIISHGSPIARLVEAWLIDQPGPWFRFIIDNGAVTALRCHEGVSSLVCLNEISHLQGLPPPQHAHFQEDGSIKPVPAPGCW